jgi:diguanylate cyclase (GGDEF)-like protein/PAS domain S-box-containing protein
MTGRADAMRVLILEDVAEDAELVLRQLKSDGIETTSRCVATEGEYLAQLDAFLPDVILSDYSLPGFDGMRALELAREKRPDTPFIFVSGTIGEELAIESLRCGATDYVLKTNLERLPSAVRRARREFAEREARRGAESELHLRHRAIEASANSIMIVDCQQQKHSIVYVNPAFERITGYSREEALGRSPAFLHGDDRDQPGLAGLRTAIREQRDGRALLRNYRKDGSLYWNDLHIAPVRDPQSGLTTHFIGIQYDITEIMRYQEQLERQANYDDLTGVANRNLLRDRLQQAFALARREKSSFCVMFVDLDNFKLINDSLGHDTGDELLKMVVARLGVLLREGDTIARLGADEFVLILSESEGEQGALAAVQRIKSVFDTSFRLRSGDFHITCSIGIAGYPRDGADGTTLMRNADTAMHRAKALGRNNFQFYSSEMNEKFSENLLLGEALWHAPERDELYLDYQPQFDLARGEVVGIEALARWRHPELGLVSPGRFIPLAEDNGMIDTIGYWVMKTACARNRQLQDAGLPPVRVGVNVSLRQLRHKGLVSVVREILQECKLAPEFLEIEITESAAMHEANEVIKVFRELSDLGVQIAIDDFGTGYSSLSYLKRFPVDRLKVDQSFVRNMTTDREDLALVRTIIALGHDLGLKVIAEGIETTEQLEALRNLGCDEGQGYFLGRPHAGDLLEARMQSRYSRID